MNDPKRLLVYRTLSRTHTQTLTAWWRGGQLRKTREEVLKITGEMVAYARSLVEDIEFSAEDALRSDWAFLAQVPSPPSPLPFTFAAHWYVAGEKQRVCVCVCVKMSERER